MRPGAISNLLVNALLLSVARPVWGQETMQKLYSSRSRALEYLSTIVNPCCLPARQLMRGGAHGTNLLLAAWQARPKPLPELRTKAANKS